MDGLRPTLIAAFFGAMVAASCRSAETPPVGQPRPSGLRVLSWFPNSEGTVTNVELAVDLPASDEPPRGLALRLRDAHGAELGSGLLELPAHLPAGGGAVFFGGPLWVIPGTHAPARVEVRTVDAAGLEGPSTSLSLDAGATGGVETTAASTTGDVAQVRQAIHDCPAISRAVGAWATWFGSASPTTNWCGGGTAAEGVRGDPVNCWDECCRSHDYCFGRGVDGYRTCHERAGAMTTDCIHACDKNLEKCWNACNAVESQNEEWFWTGTCPDGAPPAYNDWYRMRTCNRSITSTRPPPPAVGPPGRCCAGTEEECRACNGRDWNCGPHSNWDLAYDDNFPASRSGTCAAPCRGHLDCPLSCRFCGEDAFGGRHCETRTCGSPCDPGDSSTNPNTCWGVEGCEQCVLDPVTNRATCQPRAGSWSNPPPDGWSSVNEPLADAGGGDADPPPPATGIDSGPDGGEDRGPPPPATGIDSGPDGGEDRGRPPPATGIDAGSGATDACHVILDASQSPAMNHNGAPIDTGHPLLSDLRSLVPVEAWGWFESSTRGVHLRLRHAVPLPAACPAWASSVFLGGYATLDTQTGERIEVTLGAAAFSASEPLAFRGSYTDETSGGSIGGDMIVTGDVLEVVAFLPRPVDLAAAHVRVNPSAYVPADGSTDYFRAESPKVALPESCLK